MSDTKPQEVSQEGKENQTIKYYHVKTNLFRTIHADGVWYQIMVKPNRIHLIFYTDRIPIPTETTRTVGTAETPSEETERTVREGWDREMEVEVVFDMENAKRIFSDLKRVLDEQK
jgi:hypothetical protein